MKKGHERELKMFLNTFINLSDLKKCVIKDYKLYLNEKSIEVFFDFSSHETLGNLDFKVVDPRSSKLISGANLMSKPILFVYLILSKEINFPQVDSIASKCKFLLQKILKEVEYNEMIKPSVLKFLINAISIPPEESKIFDFSLLSRKSSFYEFKKGDMFQLFTHFDGESYTSNSKIITNLLFLGENRETNDLQFCKLRIIGDDISIVPIAVLSNNQNVYVLNVHSYKRSSIFSENNVKVVQNIKDFSKLNLENSSDYRTIYRTPQSIVSANYLDVWCYNLLNSEEQCLNYKLCY